MAYKKQYQKRVLDWIVQCFAHTTIYDVQERNKRFLEESLELVQSLELPKEEAYKMVDYVYGRKEGETKQEVGGVMVTLAILCEVNGISMRSAAEIELWRINKNIPQIQAKQKFKFIAGATSKES